MPIYGYTCNECEAEFELMQNINENDAPPCPHCGSATKRRYFPVGIVFKGSGFHVTDYPRKNQSGNGNGEKTAEKADKPETAAESTDAAQAPPAKTETAAPAD
ncbi:MAG: FmdB family zinc ribbon protein [Candidatus Aquicultorales bacterium]